MSSTIGSAPEAAPASPPPPEQPISRRRVQLRTVGIAAGAAMGVIGAAAVAIVLVWSPAHLRGDGAALAGLDLPPGSTVTGAKAIAADGTATPLEVRGNGLWPRTPLASGEQVRVQVTVHRPAVVGWLVGGTSHLTRTLRTPSARVSRRWLTLADGAPLTVAFDQPVHTVVTTATGAKPARRTLPRDGTSVTLARPAVAGTVSVAAAARIWERPAPAALVSWFPAGRHPVAVLHPAGGATLAPRAPIRLTLSRPVASVLGATRPTITPAVPGAWSTPDAHTLVFTPSGLGFPFGSTARVTLPATLDFASGDARTASMQVPGGSEMRLQQLLAGLGYLPLRFRTSRPVPVRADAQLAAAVSPPAGRFTWRWGSTPASLRALWTPGEDGVMTRGALMAFERDNGLTTDGLAGGQVWQALLHAVLTHHVVAPSYTYVSVSMAVPQALQVWHNGHVVVRSPVNTGVAAAPTEPGTFPVFEHVASVTMSGTNPDGSHYSDPGVPWVSYFNGGDALHGFPRGSYGVPQSVGCVELPIDAAAKVWPYTPVGTLVTVA